MTLPERIASLTPRQLEVLSLMLQGLGDKQISARIGIAERNVRLHVEGLQRRTGTNNRITLAVWATRNNIGFPQTSEQAVA